MTTTTARDGLTEDETMSAKCLDDLFDQNDIVEFVERVANEFGYRLHDDMTFGEEARYLEANRLSPEMMRILYAAEKRWWEIEDSRTC